MRRRLVNDRKQLLCFASEWNRDCLVIVATLSLSLSLPLFSTDVNTREVARLFFLFFYFRILIVAAFVVEEVSILEYYFIVCGTWSVKKNLSAYVDTFI